MKLIRNTCLILVFIYLFSCSLARAQGYYGPGMSRNVKRLSGRGTGEIEGTVHYVADKDASFDMKGTLFEIGCNYEFPSQGRIRTGRIRGTYTGGSMSFESIEAEYDYRLDIDGEWFYKQNISFCGHIGYGPFSLDHQAGSSFNYGLGINYYDMQKGIASGIILENGTFDTGMEELEFTGIKVNAMEQGDFYWLKWYLGKFDGENLIETDVCFPVHFSATGTGGYGILLRYVNVNSHAVSAGAPQLLAYGPLMGDWTEHEEWLLRFSFGIDRARSNLSIDAEYGFYRTDEFEGTNDSVLMRLGVTYYF